MGFHSPGVVVDIERYHILNDRLNALKAAVAISRRTGRSVGRWSVEMRNLRELLSDMEREELRKCSKRVSADYETVYIKPGNIIKIPKKRP